MNTKFSLLLLILVLGIAGTVYYLFHVSDQRVQVSPVPSVRTNGVASPEEVSFVIEPFVRNVFVPWSIVFTDENRMLFTERDGKLREVVDGRLREEPLIRFSEVSTRSEEGLMGLAVDPDYEQNKYLYVCLAYQKGGGMVDKIVRLKDEGNRVVVDRIILDDIPAAQFHAGCRLRFGPDGKLYASTGDATRKEIAQDLSNLGGKILRMNSDGSIPADNPYSNSYVYSYGHRNPQGFDWHPVSKVLVATEHGPSGNDGPGGGDEVNVVEAKGNFGWPLVSHERIRSGTIAPSIIFTPAVAPASGMFYTGDALPQFKNRFLFGALRGNGIYVVRMDEEGKKIEGHEKMAEVNFGRIREIAEGPDGSIYFSTSNRDGRGRASQNDDVIYVIKPR